MTDKATLHFAHANGFPAGSYRQLFDQLQDDFNIIAINKMGHNPQYPLDDNWDNLADELIHYIESNSNQPVIGVGHSFGAMGTFLSAYKRPDLFKQIIMLDPPLAMSYGSLAFYISKKTGHVDKVTPAGKTQHRKQHWNNREEAFQYFSGKKLFNGFSKEAIWDYIGSATDQDNKTGKLQLNYSVEVECRAYRTVPHNMEFKRTPLKVPGCIVRGQQSDVLNPYFAKRLAKIHKMKSISTAGEHMFPLQQPRATAQLIKEIILEQ